ncbi:PREDICTED: synergin gamma-like [Priapulus caudatus]|uniref:Synergin gamma-like n=1 Tax=Priapulus caudatus TaxID=37621 RepID=A0ABM1DQQ0_PRICU|nr:PREDICTED: synergin gamma-like [Priapulus caudatus]
MAQFRQQGQEFGMMPLPPGQMQYSHGMAPIQHQMFQQPLTSTMASMVGFQAQPTFQSQYTTVPPGSIGMAGRSQIQQMGPLQPHAQPLTDKQKKARLYQEQQKKLKQSGVIGKGLKLDADKLLSDFGGSTSNASKQQQQTKVSSSMMKPQQQNSHVQQPGLDANFGDFLGGPTAQPTKHLGPVKPISPQMCGTQKHQRAAGIPHHLNNVTQLVTQHHSTHQGSQQQQQHQQEQEQPSLELKTMMLQCSELNGPAKARGFRVTTPVTETRPTHVIGKHQVSSQRSADWTIMDERLTDDFTLPLAETLNVADLATETDHIDTSIVFPILVSSGLPRELLGHIWSLANLATPGQLNVPELYAILALIARAQHGNEVPTLKAIHGLGSIPVPVLQHPDFAVPSKHQQHGGEPVTPGAIQLHTLNGSQQQQQQRQHQQQQQQQPQQQHNRHHQQQQQRGAAFAGQPSDISCMPATTGRRSAGVMAAAAPARGLATQRDLAVAVADDDDDFASYVSRSPEKKPERELALVEENPIYISDGEVDGGSTLSFMTSGCYGDEVGARLSNYNKPSRPLHAAMRQVDEDDFADFQTASPAKTTPASHVTEQDKYAALRTLEEAADAARPFVSDDAEFEAFASAPAEADSAAAQDAPEAMISSEIGFSAHMASQHGILPRSPPVADTVNDFTYFLSSNLASPPGGAATVHATDDVLQDDFGDFADYRSAPAAPPQSAAAEIAAQYASPSSSTTELQTLNAAAAADDGKPGFNDKYALFMKLRDSSPTFSGAKPSPGGATDSDDSPDAPPPVAPPRGGSIDGFPSEFAAGSDSGGGGFSPGDDVTDVPLPPNVGYGRRQVALPEFGALYSCRPPPLTDAVARDDQSVSSLELPGADKTSSSDSERVSLGKLSEASLDLKSIKSLSVEGEDSGENDGTSLPEKDSAPVDALESCQAPRPVNPSTLLLTSQMGPDLVDKYSELHALEGDTRPQDSDKHGYEWNRCLSSCRSMLKDSNKIFNNISSSSICSELIRSEQGSAYLDSVVEIYRVACRVMLSLQSCSIGSSELAAVVKDINRLWTNLTAFIAGSAVMPEPSALDFSPCVVRPEHGVSKACGVCLLSVDQRSRAFDHPTDTSKLSYGGRQYHATCANFWVNSVDSLLPALPLQELL